MEQRVNEIVIKIIQEQSQIIGLRLACARAEKTGKIEIVDLETANIKLNGEPKEILTLLVESYGEIFGKASIDVCMDVLHSFPQEIVQNLMPATINA